MIVKTKAITYPSNLRLNGLPVNKMILVYVLKHSMMSHLFCSEFIILQKWISFRELSNTLALVNVVISV